MKERRGKSLIRPIFEGDERGKMYRESIVGIERKKRSIEVVRY